MPDRTGRRRRSEEEEEEEEEDTASGEVDVAGEQASGNMRCYGAVYRRW